jgi:hypothetical protein
LYILSQAGFANIRFDKEKEITLSDELLKSYMSDYEFAEFRASGSKVLSINVYGEKPACMCGCC